MKPLDSYLTDWNRSAMQTSIVESSHRKIAIAKKLVCCTTPCLLWDHHSRLVARSTKFLVIAIFRCEGLTVEACMTLEACITEKSNVLTQHKLTAN